MIQIENVEVSGWQAAIRGARNPKNSWHLSDSEFQPCAFGNPAKIGPNDLQLLRTLANAGPDHGKYLRMITVSMDVVAPLYWWKEADTYKVGTVADSCSTMHKIHAKEFTLDDFSHEHLVNLYTPGYTEAMIEFYHIERKQSAWYSPRFILEEFVIRALNKNRERFLETKDKRYWWQMIQLLPSSYNQRRTLHLNYAVLRSMYHARKHHKLDEWRVFCQWIETLPYSELITGGTADE